MNAQAAEKTPEKTAPAQNTKAPEKKPEAAKPTTEQKKEKPVSVNLAQLDKEEQELEKKLEELRTKKAEAKTAAAAEVFAEVRETLTKFADSFTTEQKKTLGSLLGLSATAKKTGKGGSKEATIPKFKLPEGAGGHTWSGRGRRSNEFTSWLETANGKDWTAKFAKGEVKSEYPLNPEWREANPGKN